MLFLTPDIGGGTNTSRQKGKTLHEKHATAVRHVELLGCVIEEIGSPSTIG